MTSARHPRTANATPKAPELPTQPTCAPILSTTSPKEISPTPVLTQARSVLSLARCSRASVPRLLLQNPLRNSPDVYLPRSFFRPGDPSQVPPFLRCRRSTRAG